MITGILAQQLPINASLDAVKLQASAIVAAGKFAVNSRPLAEGQVEVISDVLMRSHHSLVKHAALSVLADMAMFIPNHTALHREDGQCFLTAWLDDDVLGHAAHASCFGSAASVLSMQQYAGLAQACSMIAMWRA